MKKDSDITGNYEVAVANAAKGYVSIPVLPGTKIPAVKWKPYQTRLPALEEYRAWFAGTRHNIALLTNGLVVFDCDDPAKAELVLHHCGDTPYKLRTPRGGIHLGYRKRQGTVVGNHVRIKGEPIDIRAENGLAMIPFSWTVHGEYAWLGEGLLPLAELPVAKVGWTREQLRQRMQAVVPVDAMDLMLRRARAYLARVEGSVSGQRGHDQCMRAAGILIQKFGLSIDQAWPLLLEWNETCEPPWSEKELLHKLQDASRLRPRSRQTELP